MIIYAHDDTIIFWFMKPRMFDGHDSSLLKLLKLYTKTVWWFGTFGLFLHSVGNVIIPTDFNSMIFQRGRYTTNQMIIFHYGNPHEPTSIIKYKTTTFGLVHGNPVKKPNLIVLILIRSYKPNHVKKPIS